ncbi:MAG TPA: TlpA disulfide reductase family protein [Gammaproteobacteria bacterium]|nr:TlpA disulfide reductase family protein [Gammaproteobacteria bacterium]
MKPAIKLAAIAVLAAAAAAALYFYTRPAPQPDRQALLQQSAHVKRQARAPDFALPDLDGNLHALSQWRGRLRLINFWATWCGPCREEVPALVALQKRFGKRGFEVVGIATDEPSTKPVKAFARKYGINYPLLMDDGNAADIAAHLGFQLIGLPASVLVGPGGRIIDYHLGPIDPAKLRQQIENQLNGRKKQTNVADPL